MDPPIPPTGEQVELRRGRQRLVVVTGGAGIRTYSVGDVDVVDGYATDQVCVGGRGQLLIPWPNRVRDGRYIFEGTPRQLALSEPALGNAIHGLTRAHTWTVAQRGEASVALTHLLVAQQGYPFTLWLRVEYSLSAAGLTVRVLATNAGATAAPYGSGAHPYLRASAGLIDRCTLQVPAATRLTTDDRQVPDGQRPVAGTEYDFRVAREIGAMRLDTAFTDLARGADGMARVALCDPVSGVTVTLWMDRTHPVVMIFSGDTLEHRPRRGLAVEPMTCPPNALASGEHLVVLQPAESHASEWGITPSGLAL